MCFLSGCTAQLPQRSVTPSTTTSSPVVVAELHGEHAGQCSTYQRELFGKFLSGLSDVEIQFDSTDATQPVTVFSQREFAQIVRDHRRDENIIFATTSAPIHLAFHRGTNATAVPLTRFAMIAHPRRPIEPRIELFILIPRNTYALWPEPVYFLLPVKGDPMLLRKGECGRVTEANSNPNSSSKSGP